MEPFILIGQFDSPFVRRVGIALKIYGLPFEHRAWGTFQDEVAVAKHNPLRRVPTLVVPDGQCLVDSTFILDYLDELVSDEVVLVPRRGEARRRVNRVCAFALGFADKALALFYERLFAETSTPRPQWSQRCERQITDTAQLLDQERAAASSTWLFGEQLSHADIALAVAWRFCCEALPQFSAGLPAPALRAHSERCELLAPFQEVSMPFRVPRAE